MLNRFGISRIADFRGGDPNLIQIKKNVGKSSCKLCNFPANDNCFSRWWNSFSFVGLDNMEGKVVTRFQVRL